MNNFILIFFILVIFIILINFAWAGISAAPWLPSRKKDLKRILKLADVKKNDVVYDLGSGDGRWLFYFAKSSPAKEVRGFEISLLLFIVSWIKKLFRGYPQVKISYKSLYKAPLNLADVVICFLMPKSMKNLLPKLEKEMRPGAKLISYAFSLPGKTPEIIEKNEKNDIVIYLYRF